MANIPNGQSQGLELDMFSHNTAISACEPWHRWFVGDVGLDGVACLHLSSDSKQLEKTGRWF